MITSSSSSSSSVDDEYADTHSCIINLYAPLAGRARPIPAWFYDEPLVTALCAQVYRAWQQRRAERSVHRSSTRSTAATAGAAEPVQPTPVVVIPNTTEAFYARLTAALEVSRLPADK